MFYFLFSLYASDSSFLTDYLLDLFILGVIIVVDIIFTIMEIVVVFKKWKDETAGAEVVPLETKDDKKKRYEIA